MADTSFIKLKQNEEIEVRQGNKTVTIANEEIYDFDGVEYKDMNDLSLCTHTSARLETWTIVSSMNYPQFEGKSLKSLCEFLKVEQIESVKNEEVDIEINDEEQYTEEETAVENSEETENEEIVEETVTETVLTWIDEINDELDKLEQDNLLSKAELVKIRILTKEAHSLTYALLGNEDRVCEKLEELNKELKKELGSISCAIYSAVGEIKTLLKNKDKEVEQENKEETREEAPKQLEYNKKFDEEVRLEEGITLDTLKTLMRVKGAILIKGAPGSGKTTAMEHFAKTVVAEQNGTEDQIEFVQFSSSYSYTHIIDGLVSEDGIWKIKDGTLQKLCKKALLNPDKQYFYLIDEINRADTESVVGELLNCIERRDKEITTKNGNKMRVPKNVCIVATMNEFDSGTKKLDSATLSRFAIIDMNETNMDAEFILKKTGVWNKASKELKDAVDELIILIYQTNEILKKSEYLGNENCIGMRDLFTSYETLDELRDIVKYCIIKNIERNNKVISVEDQIEVNDYIKEIKKYIKIS